VEINVGGMGCEACEVAVKGILENSAGVVSVDDVNFQDGKARILVCSFIVMELPHVTPWIDLMSFCLSYLLC